MSTIVQPWQGLMTGWVGNMGSNKTTELIAKALDSRKHRAGLMAFQHVKAIRDQYPPDEIRARNGLVLKGVIAYGQPDEILRHLAEREVQNVFLDEVQFNDQTPEMHEAFKRVVRSLMEQKKSVYWAGLPRDFLGETFEVVGWLIGATPTNTMHILQAECDVCGRIPADLPQRLRDGQPVSRLDPRFIVDSKSSQAQGVTYEARCSLCHQIVEP